MFKVLSLYKGHLKNSKKILIFSSIGLIIALTLISSSLYFIDNSEYQLINSNLNKDTLFGNDIVINVNKDFSISSFSRDQNILTNSITNVVNKFKFNFINKSETKVTDGFVGLYDNLPVNIIVPNKNTFQAQINTLISGVLIVQLNSSLKQELIRYQSSTFRNKSIILPQMSGNSNNSGLKAFALYIDYQNPILSFSNDSLIKKGNLTIYDSLAEDHSYNLSLTGYNIFKSNQLSTNNVYSNFLNFGISTNSEYPYLDSLLHIYYDGGPVYRGSFSGNTEVIHQIYTILFVSNLKEFGNLLAKNSQTKYFDVKNDYLVHIGFDYSKIATISVTNFLSKQTFFSNTLVSELNKQNFSNIQEFFQAISFFTYIQQEIQSVELSFIIEDVPILILSFFLANFSFSLIYNDIVRNLSIYKTRGASRWIIFGFEVIDNILIGIFSVIFSLLLGIPLSALSLDSNYLLSFNNPSPKIYLFNTQSVTNVLVIWAIVIIIIINLNRIRKLSKVSIVEAENLTEHGVPFWKKHYLDILFLFFGLSMMFVYYFLDTNSTFLTHIESILFILVLLILPSPFIFVIGLILFISRLIPILLHKLSSILWFNTGGLTAYSFKNILRYKNATIRAILLTTTVIAFLLFFYSQPYTMLENYKESTYYQAGSDGTLIFQNNSIDFSTIQLLQRNFSQYIESLSPFLLLNTALGNNQHMIFLLVNTSSYVQSANLNFDLGLQNNLKNDFANLKEPAHSTKFTPMGILLDQNAEKQNNAQLGDNITVTNNNQVQRFKIIDSFIHWPFIYYSPANHGGPIDAVPNIIRPGNNLGYQVSFAISGLSYFLDTLHGNISNSIFSNIIDAGLFINFKQNINLKQVISQIENTAQVNFEYVPQLTIQQFTNSFSFLSTTGQVNIDILISLFVIVIILVLFIQFQFAERNREIYTERAIGLKLNQIAYIFYIENMILIATSLVVGFVVGILLVNLLNIVISNPIQTYPPHLAVIPFNLIILTNFIIFILAGIISIIPTLFIVRQDISDSFAREFRN